MWVQIMMTFAGKVKSSLNNVYFDSQEKRLKIFLTSEILTPVFEDCSSTGYRFGNSSIAESSGMGLSVLRDYKKKSRLCN